MSDDDDGISVLPGVAKVRLRPGLFVWPPGEDAASRLLANAVELLILIAAPRTIVVTIADGGSIEVTADGHGVPAKFAERFVTELPYGAIWLGVFNALSDRFVFENRADGARWRLEAARGETTAALAPSPDEHPSAIRIRAVLDGELLGALRPAIAPLRDRLIELAACRPGTTIVIDDHTRTQRVEIACPRGLVDLIVDRVPGAAPRPFAASGDGFAITGAIAIDGPAPFAFYAGDSGHGHVVQHIGAHVDGAMRAARAHTGGSIALAMYGRFEWRRFRDVTASVRDATGEVAAAVARAVDAALTARSA